MVNALSSVRGSWSLPVRIALLLPAVGLGCFFAWYGAGLPVEILLVAIAAISAALLGFPAGAIVAAASAVVVHYARLDHRIGDPLTGPVFLLVAGLAVSALFYGTPGSLEPVAETGDDDPDSPGPAIAISGESARASDGESRRAGLAALTAGVRAISHGDVSTTIDSSDSELRDLAVALNELLFSVRDFLADLHRSTDRLTTTGAGVTTLASATVALAADARDAHERVAGAAHGQVDAVARLRPLVKALSDSVVGARATAQANQSQLGAAHQSIEVTNDAARRVLEGSDALSAAAQQAAQAAAMGAPAADAAVEGARAAGLAAADLCADMDRLNELTGQVAGAARALDRLGERTNFIALNASLEAARNGRDSAGIASLVGEMRKVAEISVIATQEIARTIESTQRLTGNVVSASGQLARRVAEFSSNAASASTAMREVAQSADAANRQAGELGVTARALQASSERAVQSLSGGDALAGELETGGPDDARDLEAALAQIASDGTTRAGALDAVARAQDDVAQAAARTLEAARRVDDIAGGINALLARFTIQNAEQLDATGYRSARASANETDSLVPSSRRIRRAPPDSSESAEPSNGAPPPSR